MSSRRQREVWEVPQCEHTVLPTAGEVMVVELEMDGEEERSEAGGTLGPSAGELGEVVLVMVRGGKTGERTDVGGKD